MCHSSSFICRFPLFFLFSIHFFFFSQPFLFSRRRNCLGSRNLWQFMGEGGEWRWEELMFACPYLLERKTLFSGVVFVWKSMTLSVTAMPKCLSPYATLKKFELLKKRNFAYPRLSTIPQFIQLWSWIVIIIPKSSSLHPLASWTTSTTTGTREGGRSCTIFEYGV